MNRIWYFEDSSLFTQLVKCFLMSISKAACCDTLPHATRTALGLKSPVAPGRVEHVARWQVQGGLRGWRCLTYRIPCGLCPPMFLFTEEFSHAEGWSHSRYIICEKIHVIPRLEWIEQGDIKWSFFVSSFLWCCQFFRVRVTSALNVSQETEQAQAPYGQKQLGIVVRYLQWITS